MQFTLWPKEVKALLFTSITTSSVHLSVLMSKPGYCFNCIITELEEE